MTITIKQTCKRPATLANVVDALETAEGTLGVSLASASHGTKRYVKLDDKWRDLDSHARIALRLRLERNGFRPVSNRLLNDALAVANLPPLGGS
jgi:hypothetical protein